jgi:dephospho-CoA kinase
MPGPSQKRAPLIGLIGPIGSGKSTVARFLADRGAAVIDADRLTLELMAPGTPLTEAILAHFGAACRRSDGSLDRRALGRRVFSDAAKLAELEALVHPIFSERLLRVIVEAGAAEPSAVVLEAIKLVEAGHAEACDEVWLVICEPEAQLSRLIKRGDNAADAQQRIAAQEESLASWRAAATRTIHTDGSLAEIESVVSAAFTELLARADAAVDSPVDSPAYSPVDSPVEGELVT